MLKSSNIMNQNGQEVFQIIKEKKSKKKKGELLTTFIYFQNMNRLFSALHKGQFRGVISPIHKKRRLIQLRGKDTLKFLNEVSTQKVSDNGITYNSRPSIGASFLSPVGRVLFDNILYYRGPSNSFFIETENERVPELFEHFNKFRGTNGIFFDEEEAEDYNIWAFLATRKEHHEHYEKYFNSLSKQSKLLCYQDPRWPIALRLLVPKEQTSMISILFFFHIFSYLNFLCSF